MGIYKATNFARTTLAGALSAVATTATVATGKGDLFPVITGTDYSYLVLYDSLGNREIVLLTARASAADSMTITRGQLGTSARAWLAGDVIDCVPIAELFQEAFNHVAATAAAHLASAITNTPSGNIAATTVQAAINELDSEKLGLTTGGTVSGNVDFTGNVTVDGAAGTSGQVLVSQGSGATPAWGSSPADMATTGTGTGNLYVYNNTTGALELADLASQSNLVDYRVANVAGTEYEIGSGSITYTNTGGVTWTESYGVFDARVLYGSAYGAGVRVVVGAQGKIFTTTDDVTFTLRDGGFSTSSIFGVIYAGSQFVAFGAAGKLATSPDGINWTQRASAATAMASGVIQAAAYNGTTYAICGAGGYIASSTDGITWNNRKSSGSILYGMAWGNGYFVAGGAAGAMFVSTDGTTWNTRTSGFGANDINAVAYGLVSGTTATFVAVGVAGTITYSTDATYTTWSTATSGFGASSINAVAFASSLFVCVGAGGKIASDADGQGSWTLATSNVSRDLYSIGHNGTQFLVTSDLGEVMMSSTNGTTWSRRGTKLDGYEVMAVGYGGGTYLIASGNGQLSTSTDATTWTERNPGFGTSYLLAALYAGGKWVVSGDADKISTSTDGATGASWTNYTGTFGASASIRALTYGNSVYVAAGDTAKLFTSATALSGSWTSRTSGFTADNINGLAYALIGATHTFVAVGAAGKIASSVDGSAATWTLRTSPTASALNCVAYGAGRFVAAGVGGLFYYSSDGTTWYTATDCTAGAAYTINAITFANGLFVAVGQSSKILTSPDGLSWTLQSTTAFNYNYYSVCGGASNYIVGGRYSSLHTSSFGVPALSLVRSSPVISSNANGLVSFSAGTKNVSMSPLNDVALTTTTTGTGTLTLAQSRGLGALLTNNGNATRVAYRVYDSFQWEAGIGVLASTGSMVQRNTLVSTGNVTSVCHDGTKWTAFTDTQTIYTSYDGLTWTAGTLTYTAGTYTNKKYGAKYANGVYVLYDVQGYFYTSTDGTSFTQRTAAAIGNYRGSFAYGNGMWVFVCEGYSGMYYSSDNGTTWTAKTGLNSCYGAAFGNGVFVITDGSIASVYTSANGIDWTARSGAALSYSVAFGNGLFVIQSNGGSIYTSPDGITWTSRANPGFNAHSLTFGDGLFWGAGSSTTSGYSTDGITWTTFTGAAGTAYATPTAYANGRFVNVNTAISGSILTAFKAPSSFTLVRGAQESSNSNASVNFAAGTKYVQLMPYVSPDVPAADQKGKQTVWVAAGGMTARTTNGAAAGTVETTTNKVMIITLDFDATTQEYAQFTVAAPKGAIEGPITAKVEWSHAATTTNFGVAWEIQAQAISDDDATDSAWSTAVPVTDTGGTTNDTYITTEVQVPVAGSWAAEDTLRFQISRAPANSADTMAIDARLHGVRLYYYTDANNDA